MERIKNYINGKWVDAKSNETFRSINPADKEKITARCECKSTVAAPIMSRAKTIPAPRGVFATCELR